MGVKPGTLRINRPRWGYNPKFGKSTGENRNNNDLCFDACLNYYYFLWSNVPKENGNNTL